MSAVVRALLDELGPEDLAELAQRLARYLPTPGPADDGWLDAKGAAAYLGVTVKALHHRTADGSIPCHRDSPGKGAKTWFLKGELDHWRRG
jgi:hypothetical protein